MDLKKSLIKRIQFLDEKYNMRPGLSIIRIGDNPASQIYVESKKRQCEELNIRSFEHELSNDIHQDEIIDLIGSINEDPEIHGLIVQLPLPEKFNRNKILQAIAPQKDVDGLHPLNMGKVLGDIEGGFVPCTPQGCIRLLHSVQKNLKGLHAVVIGSSNLVGKPLAHLLLKEGCSISLLNINTENIKELCVKGDIVVAATGVPNLIQESWVKKGAIVIDVGINRFMDNDGIPYIVGDVDFDAIQSKVRAITSVPGGVGPMTVACLLENTVLAAELFQKKILITDL